MTDTERLQEIRARADAATPGPWRVERDAVDAIESTGVRDFVGEPTHDFENRFIVEGGYWPEENGEDRDFIAHAREDIPYLLARIEAQQREPAVTEARMKQIVMAAHEEHDVWDGLTSAVCPSQGKCHPLLRSFDRARAALALAEEKP